MDLESDQISASSYENASRISNSFFRVKVGGGGGVLGGGENENLQTQDFCSCG